MTCQNGGRGILACAAQSPHRQTVPIQRAWCQQRPWWRSSSEKMATSLGNHLRSLGNLDPKVSIRIHWKVFIPMFHIQQICNFNHRHSTTQNHNECASFCPMLSSSQLLQGQKNTAILLHYMLQLLSKGTLVILYVSEILILWIWS